MKKLKNERQCTQCQRPLFGRADKKFCSDACRNAYNNQVNARTVNLVRNVNSVLQRNRRILLELNPGGKTKIHREQLLKAGFNFDFFTSTYVTLSGEEYRYCYDQGYLILEEDQILLIVRTMD